MTSGTITTESLPPRSKRNDRRGKVLLLAALALLAVGLGFWDLRHAAWYQEWRLSRMPLDALQRERGGRLDNPRLLYYIGLRLNQQGRFAEADPYLRNAVGLDPESVRLRDAWATALLHSGMVTTAFGELRQFAGTHPNSADAHLMLGKFYVTQDSMTRAVEELTQAVKLEPSLADGWSYLAAAQSGLNHLDAAEKAAEQAAHLRPDNARDRLGLAVLQLGTGQTQPARSSFTQAIALAPRLADAHREYARCLLKTNTGSAELQQAEAEARRALALAPNDLAASLILGQTLVAEGRSNDAIPFLQQTAEHSPQDANAAFVMMQTYRRLHNQEQAKAWEQTYQARSQHAAQKQMLLTTLLKNPADPRPHQALARLMAEEGDVAGCVRNDAEALRCAPDAPPALVAAARHLTEAGHAADAVPLADRAINEARNNPMAREAMADALLALDRPKEAAGFYSQAVRGLPERDKLYHARLRRYYQLHPEAASR